jgi:hypothetical protein
MDNESALAETTEEKAFFESGGAAPPPEEEKITDPAPEAEKPAPKPEAEDKPVKETKVVPLATLMEERAERKRLADELTQRSQRMEKMEQRFLQLMERYNAGQAPEKPQAPTAEDQPIEVLKNVQQRLDERDKREREQAEQSRTQQQISAQISARETAFRQATPDYNEALEHLMGVSEHMYRAMGVQDPAMLQQMVQQDMMNIAVGAMKFGGDPAKAAYDIAKRTGYTGKPAETKDNVVRAPNGQFQAKPEEKVDTINRGQKASKSLSDGGGEQAPPLTLEALAEMDDDDFDKSWDKVMKAARRK